LEALTGTGLSLKFEINSSNKVMSAIILVWRFFMEEPKSDRNPDIVRAALVNLSKQEVI
jgi:hypothetical protein